MPTPYQSIWKSLYDKFKTAVGAGEVSTLLGGRFYEAYAPEDAVLPYAVLQLTGGAQNDTFDTDGEDQNWLILAVAKAEASGNPVADVLAIIDAFRTLLDNASLNAAGGMLTNYTVIDLRPGSVNGPLWQDGLVIASLPYSLTVQET